MTTKQTHRAVCAIQTRKTSKPRQYRYPKAAWQPERIHTGDSHLTICHEETMVEMTINLAELIDWMGRRAMCSKSGVSKLQDGMIVAKCIGQRTVKVIEEREIPLDHGAELV